MEPAIRANDTYLLRLSCYIHRNPVRAGIVDRLADYRWSSYQFYAYKNKKVPAWLTTKIILNQLSSQDHHKAYRIMVQQYSDEQSEWGQTLNSELGMLIYYSRFG